jgi:hypothetical protein
MNVLVLREPLHLSSYLSVHFCLDSVLEGQVREYFCIHTEWCLMHLIHTTLASSCQVLL